MDRIGCEHSQLWTAANSRHLYSANLKVLLIKKREAGLSTGQFFNKLQQTEVNFTCSTSTVSVKGLILHTDVKYNLSTMMYRFVLLLQYHMMCLYNCQR